MICRSHLVLLCVRSQSILALRHKCHRAAHMCHLWQSASRTALASYSREPETCCAKQTSPLAAGAGALTVIRDGNNPNTTRLSVSIPKVLLVVLATAAALLAQGKTTTTSYTATQGFPPIGLASTETAQINAVNVAAASASGTAASCTGSLSFLSNTGTAIGSATTYTLATNQIKSATLPFSSVSASSGRTEIRPVVTQTGSVPSDVPCQLQVSIETYDSTSGVTHLYISTTMAAALVAPEPVDHGH